VLGPFFDPDLLEAYFRQGVRKVIVAAPVKEDALNVVVGVNDASMSLSTNHLLTAASCTTNCLAPVVQVIATRDRHTHGLDHDASRHTNTQTIVDAPHRDLRRARAASVSLIRRPTGSAERYRDDLPRARGQLNGLAVVLPLSTHHDGLRVRGCPPTSVRGG